MRIHVGCRLFQLGRLGAAGSAGSSGRTHVCKAFSKALSSQALKIGTKAGQEEPVRGREASGEGLGARLWPALACGPQGSDGAEAAKPGG